MLTFVQLSQLYYWLHRFNYLLRFQAGVKGYGGAIKYEKEVIHVKVQVNLVMYKGFDGLTVH